MPAGYKKGHPYPGTYRTLRNVAEAEQMVTYICRSCRRRLNFLASDLLRIFDPMRDIDEPPFRCSRCGGNLAVEVTSPSAEQVGLTDVRRPVGVKRRQLWRTMKLGDPLPELPVLRRERSYGEPLTDAQQAALDVVADFKGWVLEQIDILKADNERLRLRLAIRMSFENDRWVDERAAAIAANSSTIHRLEAVVMQLDEQGK